VTRARPHHYGTAALQHIRGYRATETRRGSTTVLKSGREYTLAQRMYRSNSLRWWVDAFKQTPIPCFGTTELPCYTAIELRLCAAHITR